MYTEYEENYNSPGAVYLILPTPRVPETSQSSLYVRSSRRGRARVPLSCFFYLRAESRSDVRQWRSARAIRTIFYILRTECGTTSTSGLWMHDSDESSVFRHFVMQHKRPSDSIFPSPGNNFFPMLEGTSLSRNTLINLYNLTKSL